LEERSVDDHRKPTLKERARQARREAYRKAKERHTRDPRQAAFKEAQRQRQREALQQAKERRRTLIAERQRLQEADETPRPPAPKTIPRRIEPPAEPEAAVVGDGFPASRQRILH
jgi:hypothetical protein